jgi:hypothetical protein
MESSTKPGIVLLNSLQLQHLLHKCFDIPANNELFYSATYHLLVFYYLISAGSKNKIETIRLNKETLYANGYHYQVFFVLAYMESKSMQRLAKGGLYQCDFENMPIF